VISRKKILPAFEKGLVALSGKLFITFHKSGDCLFSFNYFISVVVKITWLFCFVWSSEICAGNLFLCIFLLNQKATF